MRSRALILLAGLFTVSCARAPKPGELSGWNVLLITIDTLRADRVGFAGYERAETPVLDELANGGVVFEDAVSSAPVTLPAHATILTGLYPPAHGALDNGFYSLPDGVPTLATLLSASGYRTAAVIGAYVLHSQFGLDRGFDSYDDRFHRPQVHNEESGSRRAQEVAERATEWLGRRDRDRPFFLWTHFFDPHAPYAAPAEFQGALDDPYDSEITYTDHWIGVLIEELQRAGVAERTLVVVVSDHGEAFGDGGELTHGLLLRGSTLRVPMLLWAPGVLPEGRRVNGVTSGADLAPTILDLLGVSPPATDGESLLPAIAAGRTEDRVAYSETRLPEDMHGWAMLAGARTDRWAWVRGPRPELYDLREDPGERTSLHESRVETAERLDARVEAVLASARESESRARLPEADVEKLRALGYVFDRERPARTGADPKDRLEIWNRVNALRLEMAWGRQAEALAGLDEVLSVDPGNHEARMIRGQCLVQLGRVEEGLAEFREILESGMALGRSGTIMARTLADAGRFDEAETLLRAFMGSEPKYAEHPYNLGVLLDQQGKDAEALVAYETAYERNPEAVHILVNLARMLSRVPEGEDSAARAIELLERAMELAPEDDRPRLVLADVCATLGLTERARAELRVLADRAVLRGITRSDVAEAMRRLGES